jgi:hypothetical protein
MKFLLSTKLKTEAKREKSFQNEVLILLIFVLQALAEPQWHIKKIMGATWNVKKICLE